MRRNCALACLVFHFACFGASVRADPPTLVPQLGHSKIVWGLAFSSDGTMLASSGEDGAIVIWDVASGTELRSFRDLDVGCWRVGFVPDGHEIIGVGECAASKMGVVRLDVDTGAREVIVTDVFASAWAIAPKADEVAWATADGRIHVLSVADRKQRSYPSPIPVVGALAFDAGGTRLAAGSGLIDELTPDGLKRVGGPGGKLVVQDAATGAVLIDLVAPGKYVSALAWTTDSKGLAVATWDPASSANMVERSGVAVFDVPAGRKVPGSETLPIAGTARLHLPASDAHHRIGDLAFSPDSTQLAGIESVGMLNGAGKVNLWSVGTGQSRDGVPHWLVDNGGGQAIAFRRDGTLIAVGEYASVQLWDAKVSREALRLPIHTSVDVLPLGASMLAFIGFGVVAVDLATGTRAWTLEARDPLNPSAIGGWDRLFSAVVTPSGRWLAGLRGIFQVPVVIDARTGIQTFQAPEQPAGTDMRTIALSPDGRWLAVAFAVDYTAKTSQVHVWDLSHPESQKPALRATVGEFARIVLTADHRMVIRAGEGLEIREVPSGKLTRLSRVPGLLIPYADGFRTLDTIPLGPLVLAEPGSDHPKVVFEHDPEAWFSVTEAVFSPGGRYCAVSSNGGIAVWNARTGARGQTVPAQGRGVKLAFSGDERRLITVSQSGMRFWDIATGEPLGTLLTENGEWIAWTNDGSYSSSRRGASLAAFRTGRRALPFQQFDLALNRPDVVLERLGFGTPDTIGAMRAAYEKRLEVMGLTQPPALDTTGLPTLTLERSAVPLSTAERTIVLHIEARSGTAPLTRLHVRVDDVPIFGRAGLAISEAESRGFKRTVPVPLALGANTIDVEVLDAAGRQSLSEVVRILCTTAANKPDLYIVAIGVSRYAAPGQDLMVADDDAQAIAIALTKHAEAFGTVKSLVLVDENATAKALEQVPSFLARSTPDDHVIVFYAGHGVLDERDHYYLSPHDMDFAAPQVRGLAYETIEKWLDSVAARRKLLLLDACHAGEIDPSGVAVMPLAPGVVARTPVVPPKPPRGAGTDTAFRRMQSLFAELRRGTGAAIIAAAAGSEYALEIGRHGVFTGAVIEALDGSAADLDQDQSLTVSELRAWVVRRVSELTGGRQVPTTRYEPMRYEFSVP